MDPELWFLGAVIGALLLALGFTIYWIARLAERAQQRELRHDMKNELAAMKLKLEACRSFDEVIDTLQVISAEIKRR